MRLRYIAIGSSSLSMKFAKWRGVQPAPVMSSTCGEIHARTVVVRASFLAPETPPTRGRLLLLVHPTGAGSAYRKETKAVDRMSGTIGQALPKSVGTVSILLKSGAFCLLVFRAAPKAILLANSFHAANERR